MTTEGLANKKIVKRSGLVGAPADNLSGRDVSSAAARLPSLTFAASPSPAAEPPSRVGRFKLKLTVLVDSPYQPRLKYDEGKLAELGESMRHGQLEDVRVRPLPDGNFEVLNGHRRKRAAPFGQLDELWCVSEEVSDSDARLVVLAANEAREDFTDFERALSYQDAISSGSARTQKQLADRIGVSVQLVQRRLSMLKLPECVITVLREYPNTFSSRWVPKVIELTERPYDAERLRQELVRVATGELQMSALFSVMASVRGQAATSSAAAQPGLSLQRNNQLFAQVTSNAEKRQVSVKIPGECSIEEVAEVIFEAIKQRFTPAKP